MSYGRSNPQQQLMLQQQQAANPSDNQIGSLLGQWNTQAQTPQGQTGQLFALAQQLNNTQPGQIMAAQGFLDQQKAQQLNDANAPAIRDAAQFKFGVLDGATGQRINPGTGEIMADANGNQMQSDAQLNNTAAAKRASLGYNAGEQSKDQAQADMMTSLAKNIQSLPDDQKQLAYERGIGLLMGKGVVGFSDVPPWDQGGAKLTEHLANLKSQTEEDVASLTAAGKAAYGNAIGASRIQAAQIKAGTIDNTSLGVPHSLGIKDQMTAILNDPGTDPLKKKQAMDVLAELDVNGNPIGKPISARAATTYTASSEGLKHVDDMSGLMQSGQVTPWMAQAYGHTGITNSILGPSDQQYNDLRTSLNGVISRVGADPHTPKGWSDDASKLLPTVGDTPKTVQDKLASLKSMFNNVRTALDPSGHIAQAMSKQDSIAPQPQPGSAPPAAAPAQTAPATPHGLAPEQWAAIQQLRAAQSAPRLQPGDRMDYNR